MPTIDDPASDDDEKLNLHDQNHVMERELEEIRKRRRVSDQPLTALCLSGGGIRSATFCLGVLQGLARWRRKDVSALEQIDYLSTVSGGGYIGSWLSRWILADQNGAWGVFDALARSQPVEPILHLRAHAHYLAPKRGLSTDTLTLASIFGRNLLLNWIVLLPVLTLVLLVPRLLTAFVVWMANATGPTLSTTGLVAGLAMFAGFAITTWVVAFAAANQPPQPNGQGNASAFTFAMPIAALCWVVSWPRLAPIANGHSIALLATCVTLGVLSHVVGVAWGYIEQWSGSDQQAFDTAPPVEANDRVRVALAVVASGSLAGAGLWSGAMLSGTPGQPPNQVIPYVVLGIPYLLFVYWIATTFYAAFVARGSSSESSEASREWWARAGAASLKPLLGWMALSIAVLAGPIALAYLGGVGASIVAVGGLAGLVSAVMGLWGRAGLGQHATTTGPTWAAWFQERILPISTSIFLIVLAVSASFATSFLVVSSVDCDKLAPSPGVLGSDTLKVVDAQRSSWDLADEYRGEFPSGTKRRAIVDGAVDAELPDRTRDALRSIVAASDPLPLLGKRFDWTAIRAFQQDTITSPAPRPFMVLILSLAMLGAVGWYLSSANKFSLHAMYGNRLIRAYLGAGRQKRSPNPFNQFDPADDVPMNGLRTRPLHIVNLALNVSRSPTADTKHLAWQTRKATSFTVSPLFTGSDVTGYRSSLHYGGLQGITLGRAMAISGAAVSPAMGYHSSTPVAAAMTLLNARLGWWLPNPGKDTWTQDEPRIGPLLLLGELLGITGDDSEWVHVSDGGHFDNLGLYEMAQRRCQRIIVVDATEDPQWQYEDLSRALRMIRVDFGAEVHFERAHEPVPGRPPHDHFRVGRIVYRDGTEGVLVVIKPMLSGDEPTDVRYYQARRARQGYSFPHESTTDQFFDEAQFESYRRLGLHSIEAVRKRFPHLHHLRYEETAAGSGMMAVETPEAETAGSTGTGGMLGRASGFLESVGKLGGAAGPALASAAIATTLVVAVNGSVKLDIPEKGLPIDVAGKTIQAVPSGSFLATFMGAAPPVPTSAAPQAGDRTATEPIPAATTVTAQPLVVTLDDDTKTLLHGVADRCLQCGDRGTGGSGVACQCPSDIGLTEEARELIRNGLDLSKEATKQLGDGVKLAVGAKEQLDAGVDLTNEARQTIGKGIPLGNTTPILRALGTQTDVLKGIRDTIDETNPRNNVTGGGR